jgi:UrcA family protein
MRVVQHRSNRRNIMETSVPPSAAGLRGKFAKLILASVAGIIGCGAAGAASPATHVPTVVVKYSQDSLANDVGVNDLYRRIRLAARQVCPEASFRDFAAQHLVEQCRDEAVARAIRQIDNSRLAALHAGHSKNG